MTPKRKKNGFTIIEITTVMSIAVITIIIFGNYLSSSFKTIKYIEDYNNAIEETKKNVKEIAKEIRKTSSGENGAFPLISTFSDYLLFYTDVDNDGDMEKISYSVSGSNLLKQYFEPNFSTNPVSYTYIKTETITNYIRNTNSTVFIYYDINNVEISTGTQSSGTPQADPSQIKLIHINLTINKKPNDAQSDYTIETSAHIRNLKENY